MRMKPMILLMLALALPAGLRADTQTNAAESVRDMARRFVEALAHEDVRAAQACWFSIDQVRAYQEAPPAGVTVPKMKENELEYQRQQWERRDRENAGRLHLLLIGLKQRGMDIAKLQLVRASPVRKSRQEGVAKIESLDVVMQIGDRTIEYWLGECGLFGTQWYCLTDCDTRPTLINKDGRSETILCEPTPAPATPPAGPAPRPGKTE